MTQNNNLRTSYEQDGFVMIRKLFDRREMGRWKDEAEKWKTHFNEVGVQVWYADTMTTFFFEQLRGSTIAEPVKSIFGGPIELLSAKPVLKAGKVTAATPWHQDRAYWQGTHKMSVWIALDDATVDNGCLKVIRGGHLAYIEHLSTPMERGFQNRLVEEQLPFGNWLPVKCKQVMHSSFMTFCRIALFQIQKDSIAGA